MIPDHIIDKAAQAIVTGMGSKSLLADMPPEDAACVRADARASLEAAVLDILSEGWRRGAHDFDIDGVYTFEERDRMNPYRASEGK